MDLNLLFEISIIDRQLKALERNNNIKEIASKIRSYKDIYEECRDEYNKICKEIKELEVSIKDILASIEEINKDIKEVEDKLYSSSSLKTIDIYQKMLENKKAEIKEKEERVYYNMERLDRIKIEKEKLLEKGNELKKIYNSLRDEYTKALNDINERIKQLNEKRELLTEQIKPKIIEEYERIKNEKGYGLCEINRDICSGCGINIPTVIINEVKDRNKITKCPHCGVILYVND